MVITDAGFDRVNFKVGATQEDHINLDVSVLEGSGILIATKTLDVVEIHDNNSAATGADVGAQTLTGAGTAADAKNFFILDLGLTKFANADAAVDALELGGGAALTFSGNIAASDAFFFAYENTTGGTNIAAAMFVAADNNSGMGAAAATGAGNLDGVDLVTIVGLADASTLNAANVVLA